MRTLLALALAILTLGAAVAGCLSKPAAAPAQGGLDALAMGPLTPVGQRHLQPFNVTDFFSHTLKPGPYGIPLPGKSVDVGVTLPATQGADGAIGRATMNLGLFLPAIPGCDWKAASLPAQCHVPVIADAGPYYDSSKGQAALQTEGDSVATQPAHRLGDFLIHNFVPYGYAVAQVSVFGTGDSTSCQGLMGPAEQAGLDASVTWLGTQPWSNGNVSLIGRSYDGSTPWEAATFGNPHLKTIVPISGLTGIYELMWHNGSAESRAPGELDALYAAMTIDGEPGDATQVLCPDYPTGPLQDAAAYATGGNNAQGGVNTYFSDRYFFGRALQNYKGSVYVIHGLQDFNVDPHMSVPLIQQMQQHWQVKGLLGQWNHMYPDRPSEHVSKASGYGKEAYPQSVRYDWAQDLLEWFNHYLKGTGPQPALDIEVQENHGAWRIESTYPPANLTWQGLKLGSELTQTSSGMPLITPGAGALGAAPGSTVTYESKALDAPLHLAGLLRLPLTVTPIGSGGQVFAQLRDLNGTTPLRLGHAIMDLRFAAGGKSPSPVVPGVPMTAKMEFEALDAVIPAGHKLQLVLQATGEDYLPASTSAPVQVNGGTLWLPTEKPLAGQYFTPPAWSGDAKATAPQP